MAKKPHSKTGSVRKDPLMQRQRGLGFDNVSSETIIELTPEQEMDRFLSRWMEIVDPFVEYKRVFTRGEKKADRLLLEVKRYFKKFVLEEDWSEIKYVLVVNNIFETQAPFYESTIEKHGKLYDNEELLSQRRLKRSKR